MYLGKLIPALAKTFYTLSFKTPLVLLYKLNNEVLTTDVCALYNFIFCFKDVNKTKNTVTFHIFYFII